MVSGQKKSKNLFPANLPSGPVRHHLYGEPCPSGSETLILIYNFGINQSVYSVHKQNIAIKHNKIDIIYKSADMAGLSPFHASMVSMLLFYTFYLKMLGSCCSGGNYSPAPPCVRLDLEQKLAI